MNNIEVKDWVRFYQNGKLVLGCVEYIGKNNYSGDPEIQTDVGSVSADYVLEVRKPNSKPIKFA